MKPTLIAIGMAASFVTGAVLMDYVWLYRVVSWMAPAASAPIESAPAKRHRGTLM